MSILIIAFSSIYIIVRMRPVPKFLVMLEEERSDDEASGGCFSFLMGAEKG